MNQMEHNVKIKNYKRNEDAPRPYLHYGRILDRNQNFPGHLDQSKMHERFQQLHWQTQYLNMTDEDKLRIINECSSNMMHNHTQDHFSVEQHRMNHLQGIKDNIQVAHERFARRTDSESPTVVQNRHGDGSTLYKIINDGTPIKY